jgi:predicted nucleic acid-binding protein
MVSFPAYSYSGPPHRILQAWRDDAKFLACAVAGSIGYIVSGDKHLLDVAKYRNVTVVKPRQFVDTYLDSNQSSSAV